MDPSEPDTALANTLSLAECSASATDVDDPLTGQEEISQESEEVSPMDEGLKGTQVLTSLTDVSVESVPVPQQSESIDFSVEKEDEENTDSKDKEEFGNQTAMQEGSMSSEIVQDISNNDMVSSIEAEAVPMDDIVESGSEIVADSTTQNPDDAIENIDGETPDPISPSYYFWNYKLSSESSLKFLIGTKTDEFQNSEKGKKSAKFLKGCKWAPDGSCLLSCSDDDNLRLFNFPSCFSSVHDWNSDDCLPEPGEEQWGSSLKIKEGGLIYDYCWYPLMSSMDAVSSCLLSTSSEAPIHLWDAFSGQLRASYQPFNHLEQLVSARSIAFDPSGETIYSGYEKSIRIFNLTRPGKQCVERPLKDPNAELNQYGIVASICVNPALRSFYAVGSYDKTIGLYYEDGSVICLLQGHIGGITHMKFSSDGMKLFTGGRNDSRLFCWDMRKMSESYKIFDRVVNTHQRIYFDVTPNDQYLVTGGTDGIVKIYEIETASTDACCTFKANSDCVNGVSCNPYIPLLATSSGQRHFFELASDSDDDQMFVKSESSRERSCDVKLWRMT